MEQNFHLLRLMEVLKTEYAAHQIHGQAGIWWTHHHNTFHANAQITWRKFTKAFIGFIFHLGWQSGRVHGTNSRHQDYDSISACLQQSFSYAPKFVGTDAKKMASFKRGLNPKMMKHVGTSTRMVFNDFISDCLKQKKNNNVYVASKNRKRAFKSGLS
jgi:hypothetical protein